MSTQPRRDYRVLNHLYHSWVFERRIARKAAFSPAAFLLDLTQYRHHRISPLFTRLVSPVSDGLKASPGISSRPSEIWPAQATTSTRITASLRASWLPARKVAGASFLAGMSHERSVLISFFFLAEKYFCWSSKAFIRHGAGQAALIAAGLTPPPVEIFRPYPVRAGHPFISRAGGSSPASRYPCSLGAISFKTH